MSKDINLRTTFNSQAQLYHAIRPRYPETLFDTLIKVTTLPKNAHLLEIGPGTGQATDSLARRGYQITAVELGADLAEVAREALKNYGNVGVVTGAFEDVDFSPGSFDLVYAATAFHWISPETRFTKPYRLLKQNGYLAVIETKHVSDEAGDPFFFASQPLYETYQINDLDKDFRLPRTADLNAEAIDENLFTGIFYGIFPLVIRYTSAEYARLLSTYSPTISMPPEKRAGFLRDIAQLIDSQFGGSILKHFAMTLMVAKKQF